MLKPNLNTVDGASQGTVRRHNRGLVLRRVFETGAISRTQIASETGLTAATITHITRELVKLNLLQEGPMIPDGKRPGRRSVQLTLPSKGIYVVGVGAGAYEQWVRVSTLGGDVVARHAIKLSGLSGEAAAQTIISAINDLLQIKQFRAAKLVGCGVAIAGVVDPQSGDILSSPNFGWHHVRMASILEDALGVAVRVESLHHALNLTEGALGRTVGIKNILLVNAALGIGGSILVNGSILRGKSTSAGLIGHMIFEENGEACTCGRRGCLDTLSSGHAVLTKLGLIPKRDLPEVHHINDAVHLKHVIDAAKKGEDAAVTAFRAAGNYLGKALMAIKLVTDPECIVIAGPLARVECYVAAVREAIADNALPGESLPDLVVSDQEVDAAGAWLALDSLIFSGDPDIGSFRVLS